MEVSLILKKSIGVIDRIMLYPFRYISSRKLLKRVYSIYGPDSLVIVLLKGVGDTIYGLAFLEALKTRHKKANIVVIGNEKLEWLIEKYPFIDTFEPYNTKNSEYKRIEHFFLCERVKKIALFENIYNTDPFHVYSRIEDGKTAISLLRNRVFNLDSGCPITFPQLDSVSIDFIDDSLKESKKIIINPYSNSISEINIQLYAPVVKRLNQLGYVVFTNLIDGQECIPETIPLKCSLIQLVSIIRQSRGVVSVRSGILDLIINEDIPILAIYANCTDKFKNIYTLNGWNGNSRVTEIDYDGMKDKEFYQQIENWISSSLK